MLFTPARPAACIIARACSTVIASGFSQITCLPCSAAATLGSQCTSSGVQLSITWILGSSTIRFQSAYDPWYPNFLAFSSAPAVSQRATNCGLAAGG